MSGTIHNPIHGLYTKQAFGKSLHKGEDAWLQQPKLSWTAQSENKGSGVGYDVYGVFDGHGGKQAATFASKHVLPVLQEELADVKLKTTALPEELESFSQISHEDKLVWQTQDALLSQLPAALVKTFRRVQDQFHEHTQVSGTTATVAVFVGWDVLLASVGDSTAYLDTGAEVIQVSDTHRLDDNKTERKRCEDAGFEVSRSTVDGKPVGPERVWPGGLAMSRTIGDHRAGDVVLPEPEVRRVTLPSQGARLIIASDGLWDAVKPKTAAHHIRGMQAGKAAGELVQAALKAKGVRDDITVLVIDAMPDNSHRLPPFLAKQNSGNGHSLEEVGSVDWHKPLDEPAAVEVCAENTWQRRIAAVQTHLAQDAAYSSGHSSDTMAQELQSARSDSSITNSAEFQSPFTASPPLLEEDSSEWETVPVKHKVEASAAASSPDGWADGESSEAPLGQWEVPHKQTKLKHQPDETSPTDAKGIKAMHNGMDIAEDRSNRNSSFNDGSQMPFNRGRGRGRGRNQGRVRGRGRNNGYDNRRQNGHTQRDYGQSVDDSDSAQHQQNTDGDLASSWGAETVFPLTSSPLLSSSPDTAEPTGSAPRVLTIRRPPQPRSVNQSGTNQQQQQQYGRSNNTENRGLGRGRGRNRGGRGSRNRQSDQEAHVQSGPVYNQAEQPAAYSINFGSIAAGDFGSMSGPSNSAPGAISTDHASADNVNMYQETSEPLRRPHPAKFAGRGRGRGRGRGQGGRGNFASEQRQNHVENQNVAG